MYCGTWVGEPPWQLVSTILCNWLALFKPGIFYVQGGWRIERPLAVRLVNVQVNGTLLVCFVYQVFCLALPFHFSSVENKSQFLT